MRWWYPRVRASLLVPLLIFLALTLALSFTSTARAAQKSSCDGPVTGKHVYDCAGILTADEVAEIETHVAAVEQAGAPTIVYLQVRDASVDETIQDAADLMDAWDVESSPGAHDGFVMFLNLLPGNERHGKVALYAGEKHTHGNLPQQELQRIISEVMAPLLKEEQTATGIIAGLDAVAHDLRSGPPPNVAASFIRLPGNILAVLLAAAVCLLYLKMGRRKSPAPFVEPRTTPPGDLTPDLAGALVRGKVDMQLIQATILYMAHKRMLVVERYKNHVALRLLDHEKPLPGIQQPIWELLTKAADADYRVCRAALAEQRSRWLKLITQLREDLMKRQWYDRRAGVRRSWLGWSSALLLFLGCFDLIASLVVGEAWGFLGSALLLGFGIAAVVWAVHVPNTTALGESIAASWRAYRAGLEEAASRPRVAVDLDAAIPYALAMGAERFLLYRLVLAGGRGAPVWLLAPQQGHSSKSGFAHYWDAFRAELLTVSAPASHSGGYHGGYYGGGFGGGASSGGGGAGSSF